MKDIIATLCKILDFTNLFLVITDKDGIITSISNKISKHIANKIDDYKDINGKCWFDYINQDKKEEIREIYKRIFDEKNIDCIELEYSIISYDSNLINVRWVSAFINHDSNLIMSVGMPIESEETEKEFDLLREKYLNLIREDRKSIEKLKISVIEKSERIFASSNKNNELLNHC